MKNNMGQNFGGMKNNMGQNFGDMKNNMGQNMSAKEKLMIAQMLKQKKQGNPMSAMM